MEFRTLHLEDKAAVNDVLLPLGRNDSALGFANLYSLTEKYGTQIALEDGVLYVRQLDRIPGAVAYYPPLGTLDIADDVRTLMREAQAEGRRLHLVGLSPKEKEQLEADLPGAFEFSSDRNFADYLYLTKTIAAYEGPGLAKKRRETNKFFQLYGSEASFEPIALDHMDELRAYQQVWFETSRRRGTDEHPLELEHRKILLDMNHFEELDLEGILLRIGGTVEGYAYGSVLPGGAFDVMVLKGNLDFRFVWRALLRELARYCVDKATYLNLEEDLGLPGLRENKLSYQPCALMESTKAACSSAAAAEELRKVGESSRDRRVAVRAPSPDADSSPAFRTGSLSELLRRGSSLEGEEGYSA